MRLTPNQQQQLGQPGFLRDAHTHLKSFRPTLMIASIVCSSTKEVEAVGTPRCDSDLTRADPA
jgi:hypothetical protein